MDKVNKLNQFAFSLALFGLAYIILIRNRKQRKEPVPYFTRRQREQIADLVVEEILRVPNKRQ